jgi:hypothetical protein
VTWLVRMLCPHRVLIDDGHAFVCQSCGTTLLPGRAAAGDHALLRRARVRRTTD